jgi:cytochrome c-type biogenesis protein CcsB
MIIDIPAVESLCANSCFVILFFTTLYYWSKLIFDGKSTYTQTGLFGYVSSVIFLTTHLILRWIDSGHFPLSNLYESLIFLAWCILIIHIYIEYSMKTLFLGVLTSPAILCLIAFTDFSLPIELQRSSPLVPALQSNWLVMHVTVMIASYAALLLGCLVAISYLIFSKIFEKPKNLSNDIVETLSFNSKQILTSPDFALKNDFELADSNLSNNSLLSRNSVILESEKKGFNFLETFPLQTDSQNSTKILFFLDNLSYRTIGIGFCFLTLGILSGAVWANETWGNYWSWDPKETWAFITWLTFAAYLHSRLVGGWTGSKPAWIASFGFLIVWTCYLGVNLLGQGLHSYGFLQI